MGRKPRTTEPIVSRRNLLKTGTAGVLGVAAAGALRPTQASADDGDPIILGEENFTFSETKIQKVDAESLSIFPAITAGRVLSADGFFGPGPAISANLADGTAISGGGGQIGVSGGGDNQGVWGISPLGAGVQGTTDVGTAVKAQALQLNEGTALEAIGPVKFSTSGLATIAAGTERVTVNPGVPLSSDSKVLAMLQEDTGNRSTVERVGRDPSSDTFQIVLTRPSKRAVQVGWFLIS
jgi:hypothetical protein